MATPDRPTQPPVDYSAAYVDELINQQQHVIDMIQIQLSQSEAVLQKLRVQVRPH